MLRISLRMDMQIKSLSTWLGLGVTCVGNGIMAVLPNDFNWLGWPFILVGVSMLLVGLHEWIFDRLKWKLKSSWQLPSVLPFKILVPLDVSARIANEKLRGTFFGRYVANLNKGNDILIYYAYDLCSNGKLYGTKKPSESYDIVDQKHMGHIGNLGKNTTNTFGGEIIYDNLMIERKTLKKYIKEKKNVSE